MATEEQGQIQVKSYGLYDRQVSAVRQFAKDEGRNESSALRRIIDEWLQFKGSQLPLPLMDVHTPEAAR